MEPKGLDSINTFQGHAQLGRSSGRTYLFDSQLEHHAFIKLEISTALNQRQYHEDKVYPDKHLIEVWFSASQWAELITNMNCYSGASCTINHVLGKSMPRPEAPPKEAYVLDAELESNLEDIEDGIETLRQTILNLKITEKQKKELLGNVSNLNAVLQDKLPFILTMYRETLEKMTQKAKSEVVAYVEVLSNRLGLTELPRLIGGSRKDESE
jgi:hypothetical protein